jgi:hypothetical protein
MSLFSERPPPLDPLYTALRDGTHPIQPAIREFIDGLWREFSPYADKSFQTEIARPGQFHSRYWEMYLVSYLLSAGYAVSAPKPGPDAGIRCGGAMVWFEATAPGPGVRGAADSVPELDLAYDDALPCPDPRTILRYRGAFREKADNQYFRHRAHGIVGALDPYVIALNGGTMLDSMVDGNRGILAALYGLGGDLLVFPSNGQPAYVVTGYRPAVRRTSGAPVATNVFLDARYGHVTAILFSGVSAGNPLSLTPNDFILLQNPNAINPLSASCLPSIPEWIATGTPGESLTVRKRARSPV